MFGVLKGQNEWLPNGWRVYKGNSSYDKCPKITNPFLKQEEEAKRRRQEEEWRQREAKERQREEERKRKEEEIQREREKRQKQEHKESERKEKERKKREKEKAKQRQKAENGLKRKRSVSKKGKEKDYEIEKRAHEKKQRNEVKKYDVANSTKLPSSLTISYKNLELKEKIGGGGFGIVYRAIWHGEKIAVKQMLVTKMTELTTIAFVREAEVMAQLRHPHVIQYFGFCNEVDHYGIVMECMTGSLYDVLHSQKPLDWPTQVQIAYGIGSGLSYLHDNGIIHRDLKSPNVLLDNTLREVKLTDFGLAELKEETKTTTQVSQPVGSLSWMAPELFKLRPSFTKASDVYAYGIILWEILTRRHPYQGAVQSEISTRVAKGEREEIPKNCSSSYAKIIRRCWHGRVNKRPLAQEVMKLLESESASLVTEEECHPLQFTPSAPPASTTFFQPAIADSYTPSVPPLTTLTQIASDAVDTYKPKKHP